MIQFPKPLTLIVGRNGAGKTTIIECLKMGSTGELPPSARSGQAFIHDPKVADVTEVKAQIKLRFRNVMGKPFVVIRSFQLTQKARGKLEKKDLDSVIQSVDDGGKMVSISREVRRHQRRSAGADGGVKGDIGKCRLRASGRIELAARRQRGTEEEV